MTGLCKTAASHLAIVVLVFFPLGQTTALAAGVTYTVFKEEISDLPTRTLIVQRIVASGVPTKAELEAEILKRYRAVMARRGFRYNNPATNIGIFVYGTKEQAHAGQYWIGMISKVKGISDKKEPQVDINEDRLAALSQAPEERFGLSEQERKHLLREIGAAQDRADREARARVPDSQVTKQIDLYNKLRDSYQAEVAQHYGLTNDQVYDIRFEGIKKGWPIR